MNLFGRILAGTADVLRGYKISTIEITDKTFLSKGEANFQNTLTISGDKNDMVAGTALELTNEELLTADKYEPANYRRIKVTLESGRKAWIYLAIRTTLAPWITVQNGALAVEFYKTAFDAVETYRLETPDGLIVRLAVNGPEFWISGGSENSSNAQPLDNPSIRMILTVPDPDATFQKALRAGASEIFPVGEEHGWRLGRIVDPFGLHWEIGYQISE